MLLEKKGEASHCKLKGHATFRVNARNARAFEFALLEISGWFYKARKTYPDKGKGRVYERLVFLSVFNTGFRPSSAALKYECLTAKNTTRFI